MSIESVPTAEPAGDEIANRDFLTALLDDQQQLTAVERFSAHHDTLVNDSSPASRYAELIPLSVPEPGQQYAFEVDLDVCSGCKACVIACHTMNGLEEDETWRRVGVMSVGTSESDAPSDDAIFHITSACHHCLDPGCQKGCPVNAYDKDPVTGIVRHLDDQCIGCKYCTMMCPYEVPQYSHSKGIVRKCDMCRQRLSVGEAPACVQACPNEAIRIRTIGTADVRAGASGSRVVPGAPDSDLTIPTTLFKTSQEPFARARAQDAGMDAPAESHWPLAVMLVLTQCSVGLLLIERTTSFGMSVIGEPQSDLMQPIGIAAALVIAMIGLNVAPLHLGKPLKAWRVFLGLRTSWLSREAIVLGKYTGLLFLLMFVTWMPHFVQWLPERLARMDLSRWVTPLEWMTVAVGVVGLYSSAMIYIATGRAMWRYERTMFRFGMSAMICGGFCLIPVAIALEMTSVARVVAFVATALLATKLVWEHRTHWGGSGRRPHEIEHESDADLDWRARRLARNRLSTLIRLRIALAAFGFALVIAGVAAAARLSPGVAAVVAAFGGVCILASELSERLLYFRGVVHRRMPGAIW